MVLRNATKDENVPSPRTLIMVAARDRGRATLGSRTRPPPERFAAPAQPSSSLRLRLHPAAWRDRCGRANWEMELTSQMVRNSSIPHRETGIDDVVDVTLSLVQILDPIAGVHQAVKLSGNFNGCNFDRFQSGSERHA